MYLLHFMQTVKSSVCGYVLSLLSQDSATGITEGTTVFHTRHVTVIYLLH